MATHRCSYKLWKECCRDSLQGWGTCKSKAQAGYPHFMYKRCLWFHACCILSGLFDAPATRGLAMQAYNARLCETHKPVCPDRAHEAAAFVAFLLASAKNKDICKGTRLHHQVLKRGLLKECADALVTMYAKCGSLAKAENLLAIYSSKDLMSWTALIAGYAHKGQGHDALHCFERLQQEGLSPDVVTFSCILKACGSIKAAQKGGQIHDEIVRQGLLGNIVLGSALVDMYAKCGALAKAQQVLEELPVRDVVAWSSLIAGYAQEGRGEQALDCFERMQHEGVSANAVTFVCILKACGSTGATEKGEQVHDEIARRGLLGYDVVLGTALVDMYAKCGALTKARRALEELPIQNVVSWSALIAGYAQQGQGEEALNCFDQMQHKGFSPNVVTFGSVLKACGSIRALDKGEQFHEAIARQGLLDKSIVLGTALVDMYAKCGALVKAQKVLENLPGRDVVSWSALIEGYAQQGQAEQALDCFERMQHEGSLPNIVTYLSSLKACGSIGAVDRGEQIHKEIAGRGLLENETILGNAVVDMYAKCGALQKAQQVLEELPVRDVVSWSALIEGNVQQGQGEQALNCFDRMQRKGISPNAVTFLSVLKACGSIGAADRGEKVHDEIARQGLLGKDIVLGTALVDMYAKCGALSKAQQVLEDLPVQNAISWNALIAGYSQQGQAEQAFAYFERMKLEGLPSDSVTFLCLLKACSTAGAADMADRVYDEILWQGLLENNLVVSNAMVDTYAKCGALEKAQQVLEELPVRDVVSWSSLIAGYTQQGQGEQALNCFEWMQHEGLSPNAVTFSGILKACGSLGAAGKGALFHDEIATQRLLGEDLVIGTALMDMYAKCGALAKARQVFKELPVQDIVSWNAMIAGCVQQGQTEQAMECFEQMKNSGFSPNAVTLVCILKACGILGLVDDAHMHFTSMSTNYGIKPGLEHYTCIVNVLGRAGYIDKAMGVTLRMPSFDNSSAVWSSLLGACRKWGDVNVGRWAFKHRVQVGKSDEAAYVLMTDIYIAAGMQEDAEIVEAIRMGNSAWKKKPFPSGLIDMNRNVSSLLT